MISQTHQTEVEFISVITNRDVGFLVGALEVMTMAWAALIVWLATVRKVFSWGQLFEISAVSCVLLVLPPLWGFAFYFCAIHSFRHVRNVKTSISTVSKNDWIVVWGLTILSALLVLVGLTWFNNEGLYKGLIQSTFIVLASLHAAYGFDRRFSILEKLTAEGSIEIPKALYQALENKFQLFTSLGDG